MKRFITDMRIAKMSPVTIKDRVEVLERLQRFLGAGLLEADEDRLREFQATYAHLTAASVNVYTRHIKSFYMWACARGEILTDPAEHLIVPRVQRGVPHPTTAEDLRTIFACSDGALRVAYLLATFVGLRRGEICRLRGVDLDLYGVAPSAIVNGKGGKERTVPLIPPVAAELKGKATSRLGFVITKNGQPYKPSTLSIDSHYHLKDLGLETTLHSMRHTFATNAVRITHDPLLVRDLLGHESVATTEIYMRSSMDGVHDRLEPMSADAARLLAPRRLHAV